MTFFYFGIIKMGSKFSDACKQRGFPFAWCHKPKSRNGTFIGETFFPFSFIQSFLLFLLFFAFLLFFLSFYSSQTATGTGYFAAIGLELILIQ